MTLLTTLLDFTDTGEIGLLVSEEGVAQREAAIGKGGLLKGSELAQVFASLRANDLIWPYVVKGYLKGQAPPAFDLLYWNSDDTNLPGPMFCWYLRNTYLENKLREPGAHRAVRRAGRSGRHRRPGLHLRLAKRTTSCRGRRPTRAPRSLAGDTTFVLGASGHIAGVINPPAKIKRNYWTLSAPAEGTDPAAFTADPDAWFDSRGEHPRQLVAGLDRMADTALRRHGGRPGHAG